MSNADTIIHTLPQTAAEQAVIRRVHLLTDLAWTPLRDIPAFVKGQGYTILPAGVPVTGLPYSSTEATDKFITENVSLYTFLSTIPNPYSKLYQVGHGAVGRCNYGMVCNGFVRFAFGIPYRVSTACWGHLDGMRPIAAKQSYTVNEMQLCDVLHAYNDGRNHVALISDILKDENGTIVGVEVAEAVAPLCKRAVYTPAEYYEKYYAFALWRYDHLESVPPFDETLAQQVRSGMHTKTPLITVDNGDASNYLEGEEILLSVFSNEPDTVEVYKGEEMVAQYSTLSPCFLPLTLPRGYYTAKLKNAGCNVSFAVMGATISHTVRDGFITIHADPQDANSTIQYIDYRVAGEKAAAMVKFDTLTAEEKQSGVITRPIPQGAVNFKVYFQNAYGVWAHRMIKI